MRHRGVRYTWIGLISLLFLILAGVIFRGVMADSPAGSKSVLFRAPAGTLPATEHTPIDGYDAAILPTGRIITPVGTEVSVGAPKPYGMALSGDGSMLATINSGVGPFSVTLIRNLTGAPQTKVVTLDATFQGVAFSRDGSRFFASGGEDGLVWVGDSASGAILAVVNLNTPAHPLSGPINPASTPPGKFRGTFPGSMTLDATGRYLHIVDQGGFLVHTIDTTKIDAVNHGILAADPNNFPAVIGTVKVGRYPFAIAASPDNHSLFVANVGIFQYKHLDPVNPTGDPNHDYPLGYPGTAYPDDMDNDKSIQIKKVDTRHLPDTLRDPEGIRVGYIAQD